MAASRMIEEGRGTYTGDRTHRHNGYWAGDFFADGILLRRRPHPPRP